MKLCILLLGLSLLLTACDPGGTVFDEVFHPPGKCAEEVKVLNQSSKGINISASLYDDGPAYCKGDTSSKDEKTVPPGEFGSVKAELTCNRCWVLQKTAFADGRDASGTNVITCTDSGCHTD